MADRRLIGMASLAHMAAAIALAIPPTGGAEATRDHREPRPPDLRQKPAFRPPQRPGTNRYTPHQGKREQARRLRQLAKATA